MSGLLPEIIENKIYLIRGQKVMLDRDLAGLYGVETKQLTRQVRRNIGRFPEDFMFQLTREEYKTLIRCHFGTLNQGQHSKYNPYVFTEHGILMLSSVLNSEQAINVNIEIMRTFTRLRQLMATHKELREKIEQMEKKYDKQFQIVFEAIKQLMVIEEKPKKQIGFHVK